MIKKIKKFEYHIYYAICESSSILFESSNFSTYNSFCETLRLSLINSNLSSKDIYRINKINEWLDKMFGLDYDTNVKYIMDYFIDGHYHTFHKIVIQINNNFRESIYKCKL